MYKLPENAYRKLKEGEVYKPLLSPNKSYREATFYSVTFGIIFAIIFTFALMYLMLKLGLGISADTPVAIIALGLSISLRRSEPMGENVVMFYIPYIASAIMTAGVFIFPAFVILGLKIPYWNLFICIILGGLLGSLVSILFRKYFVEDMHGIYPYPGSYATSEILVSSEGNSAKTMLISGAVGLVYDFITGSIGLWNETLSTKSFYWGKILAEKMKMVLSLDVSAAFLGIGFLTGVRYSAIIGGGAIFGACVCIPLIAVIIGQKFGPSAITVDYISAHYVKFIGVGALATGGIIGLINMLGVIWKSMAKAIKDTFKRKSKDEECLRTQKGFSAAFVLVNTILIMLFLFCFLYFRVTSHSLMISSVSLLIVFIFSCLFSIVAATSIAYTNADPVSGMTILMMVLGAVIFAFMKLNGGYAAMLILVLATTVCAVLAQTGYAVGGYKTGYLLGSTPKTLEIWGIISTVISAPIIVGVFVILEKTYGFVGKGALAAPQANAMAGVLQPLLSGQQTPWVLYIVGAIIAIIVTMCGISALPFALGMYLPVSLTTPFIIGGILSWIVSSSSKDEKINFTRKQKGFIVSAGLIAGGAIAGIATAFLQMFNIHLKSSIWLNTSYSQGLSLLALLCLSIYVVAHSMKVNNGT